MLLTPVLYILSKRRRSIQEDNDRSLVPFTLCNLDSRVDCGERDIHGACAGCRATAKEQVEASASIIRLSNFSLIPRFALCAKSEWGLVYSAKTSNASLPFTLPVPDRPDN